MQIKIHRRTIDDIIAGRNVGGVNDVVIECKSDDDAPLNNADGGVNADVFSLKRLTNRQKRITELIRLKPTVTVQQMTLILSIPKRTIERDLALLQKIKVISHEGSDKTGVWVVLEP